MLIYEQKCFLHGPYSNITQLSVCPVQGFKAAGVALIINEVRPHFSHIQITLYCSLYHQKICLYFYQWVQIWKRRGLHESGISLIGFLRSPYNSIPQFYNNTFVHLFEYDISRNEYTYCLYSWVIYMLLQLIIQLWEGQERKTHIPGASQGMRNKIG